MKGITEFITCCEDLPEKIETVYGYFGSKPLHEAVSHGHAKVAALLLQHGADVNSRAIAHGSTSLHLAVSYGNAECVRVLLANGADITMTDHYMKTPLQQGVVDHKYSVAKILRSAG